MCYNKISSESLNEELEKLAALQGNLLLLLCVFFQLFFFPEAFVLFLLFSPPLSRLSFFAEALFIF